MIEYATQKRPTCEIVFSPRLVHGVPPHRCVTRHWFTRLCSHRFNHVSSLIRDTEIFRRMWMRVLICLIMSGRIIIIPNLFFHFHISKSVPRLAYENIVGIKHFATYVFKCSIGCLRFPNVGIGVLNCISFTVFVSIKLMHEIWEEGLCTVKKCNFIWQIRTKNTCLKYKSTLTSQSTKSKNPINILIRFVKHTQYFVYLNKSDIGIYLVFFLEATLALHSSKYSVR